MILSQSSLSGSTYEEVPETSSPDDHRQHHAVQLLREAQQTGSVKMTSIHRSCVLEALNCWCARFTTVVSV